MYIQNYFKDGRPKKYKNKVVNLKQLLNMFEDMNGSKEFKEFEIDNNFSKRDIVFEDGSKENLWKVMQNYGFSKKEIEE
jgi:hypothetical protein